MSKRPHRQKQTPAPSSSALDRALPAPRPFAAGPQDGAQVAQAHDLGHSLDQVQIFPTKPLTLQAKLTVTAAGDQYEQEADRVAAEVVRRISVPAGPARVAQPQESAPALVQRRALAGSMAVTPDLDASIQRARAGGAPLAASVRAPMEQAFGYSFANVRVHDGGAADLLNRSLSARAFTTGRDIFFRRGEYNPASAAGQTLLAHELTHVVQQGESAEWPIQRQVGNINFVSYQNLEALQRIRINFLRFWQNENVGTVSDEDVEAWAKGVIQAAHDGAYSILQSANQAVQSDETLRERNITDPETIRLFRIFIPGAVQQMQQVIGFTALDRSVLQNDDGTTAFSTFGQAHITLRETFYQQNMLDRASTIVHEIFHIIGRRVLHDPHIWHQNAYQWEKFVFQLAGIAWRQNRL